MRQTCPTPAAPDAPCLYLPTGCGMNLRIRPVTDRDTEIVSEFFAGLARGEPHDDLPPSRKGLIAGDVGLMLDAGHARCEHLLAFDTSTGKLAGSLLMASDPPWQSAEVAITVGSAFRGRGIGAALLEHALRLARRRGIRRIRSLEDLANHEALAIEQALGFRPRGRDSAAGMVSMEAELA